MKTMIYLVEQDTQNIVLAPVEQEFLSHITIDGISLPDLVKALGRTVKTVTQKGAFLSVVVALKAKGLIKTKTVGARYIADAA